MTAPELDTVAAKAVSPRESIEEEGAPLLSPAATEASLALPELAPPPKKKPWVLLCTLVFLLVAIIDVGAFLAEAPKTRVYESNICLQHFEAVDPTKVQNGVIAEELCKEDVIQQRMASIFGWQELFDAIPGILLAVPFGTMADKKGRKWVFVTSLMGLQLNSAWILFICYFRSLPLKLTWFSSVFYLIGGGPIVATAIAITMVSDIVPPEKRTSIFLYLMASVLVAELIAPIIAAKMMEHGDWLPLLLALAIQQVGVFVGVFFPETLHLRDLPEATDNNMRREELELMSMDKHKDTKFRWKDQLGHLRDALTFLRRDSTVALVILTFFVNRIGRQALSMLIRYASKRYNWKIQKAAYLLSFRAATNLVSMTVFVPVVNLILIRLIKLPTHSADLWIAKGSIILLAGSFVIMGVAAHPALLIIGLLVYNLGTGYNAAMRSISIHVIGGQSSPDVGRLFAVIAIFEAFGSMIAGPLLAAVFEWGIKSGEPWIGMPYLLSAAVFGIVTAMTWFISVKDEKLGYVAVSEEDEEAAQRRLHQD